MATELKRKMVCLVCGVVMTKEDVQLHLAQNRGHAIVEGTLRWDDEVSSVDINTSIFGRTDTWGDVCRGIYTSTEDVEQKQRLVSVVNAGFITALKTRNFDLAKMIAGGYFQAGVITEEDYQIVVEQIDKVKGVEHAG